MQQFDLPVGYHQLHKTKIIDYQLNRRYSMGYERLEDMRQAGGNIKTLDDWKDEMLRQAERALADGRFILSGRTIEYSGMTRYKNPTQQSVSSQRLALYLIT